MNLRRLAPLLFLLPSLTLICAPTASAKWKYFRSGNAADSTAAPRGGFALMGGGGKQDSAFQFLCERANGGDFLILRASGDDDYIQSVNKDMQSRCKLNSAASILFTDREDSDDPKLLEIIQKAESIFIAGGDQSNYLRYWQDTPVQDALNAHISAGKPIGGSSAGLAVLGEFSFSSMIDTIHSPQALANPYGNEVTLSRDFLRISLLQSTITDTHFVKRDRMGRLLVFLGRMLQDGWASEVKAIAVEEDAAFLLEPDGTGTVVGKGPVYFLNVAAMPSVCKYKQPLSLSNISVLRAEKGAKFNVKEWKGETVSYVLNVNGGKVTSTAPKGSIY